MTVKASNCNAPIWRDVTVKACLPAELSNLETVARNLWWVKYLGQEPIQRYR